MKRSFLCVLVICLLGAGAAQAAAVLAGPVPLCSTFAVDPSNPNDLAIQYGVFSVADFACEQQDKIYSNFSQGALPDTSTLRIQLQPLVGVDFHTVTFNGKNTALHVEDVYTANGGAAVSISNTFREDLTAGAPETYSYLLVGGGFLLLASLRRIRRRP
jgi:hypothetical protein